MFSLLMNDIPKHATICLSRFKLKCCSCKPCIGRRWVEIHPPKGGKKSVRFLNKFDHPYVVLHSLGRFAVSPLKKMCCFGGNMSHHGKQTPQKKKCYPRVTGFIFRLSHAEMFTRSTGNQFYPVEN